MSPGRVARHSATLAWRGVLRLKHSPDQLLDVVLMPISFTVMFVFLFGTSVAGDWRAYLQYVLPGIAVQAMLFASLGSAIALNVDMRTGIFDRLRSLPIARSAPLTGHILSDLVKYLVALVVVFGFGSALGFRFHGDLPGVLAGCALLLFFAFAVGWLATVIGVLARNPEGVQSMSFALIFPLTFGSNVFVPTNRLPGWLQAWVRVNPVTSLSNAARGLMLGLPTGHATIAALAWSAGIVAAFAPLAVLVYRWRV